MRCCDVMTRDVITVPTTLGVEDAVVRMRLKGCHHLIVTEGKTVVGVVSARDVSTGRVASAQVKGLKMVDVMSPNPVTVEPDTTVKRAANVLRGHGIGCLPVVDNGRLVGIITVSDLLELIGRGIEKTNPAEKRREGPKPGGRRGAERPRGRAPRVRGH